MKRLSLFLVARTMLLVSCKPEIEKPTVVTKSVSEVTKTTAKVVGQVAADGGAEVTERGVCWSTDGTPTILDFRVKDAEGGLGTFTLQLSDLESQTTYYVRAYATNEAGTSYGEEKSFVTGEENEPEQPEEGAPVVKTAEVTDIKFYSAKCGGEVISNGDVVVVAKGVCWSTIQNPTIEDNRTTDVEIGSGSYVSNLTELNRGTTYYVRAYAINAQGITSYGEEVSFSTLDKLSPTTVGVSEITGYSAASGGEVAFDGGVKITARGVCWSTSKNPTIEDDKTINDSGIGTYKSRISGLKHNTTYYVRSYATNEVGTFYGDEVMFTTKEVVAVAVDLGLPSGLKWATCNVGADSPEDYGDHFAWGETATKETYTQDNSLTYVYTFSGLLSKGYIDEEGNLTPQYDAATANWGGSWRMPTHDDMIELASECELTWTTQNGVNGCKVTGPNGNSIFLPAAGYRSNSSLKDVGDDGFYWSSFTSSNQYGANYYRYFSGGAAWNRGSRHNGWSVRPVLE